MRDDTVKDNEFPPETKKERKREREDAQTEKERKD